MQSVPLSAVRPAALEDPHPESDSRGLVEPPSLSRMPSPQRGWSRTLVVAGALGGVTVIALAVALIGGPSTESAAQAPAADTGTSTGTTAAPTSTSAQPQPYPGLSQPAPATDAGTGAGTGSTTTPKTSTPSHHTRSPGATTSSTSSGTGPSTNASNASTTDSASPQAAAATAHDACATCGTVLSVKAVTVQGDNTGVGAVGGGAAGALVGSQIAGRGNHTIGGIVGAIGGALVGNHVEKSARRTTAYDVRVRMEDGTVKTVRQSTAPPVGEKVDVEGHTLKPART